MAKIDLKKEYKHLYNPSAKEVGVVDVPEFKFLLVDGTIPPGAPVSEAPEFVQAMEVLYGLSYGIKFASKKHKDNPVDYTVMPLEGLWWVDGDQMWTDRKIPWYFSAMMMQPAHISEDMFQLALAEFKRKKGDDNPALAKLRFETFHEGLCVQVMHLGPYADEPATIERMDAYATQHGYQMHGKHHEIYLGDPRRADPTKLKTVLRHPVKK